MRAFLFIDTRVTLSKELPKENRFGGSLFYVYRFTSFDDDSLEVLFAADPTSVGGKLPTDEFYGK